MGEGQPQFRAILLGVGFSIQYILPQLSGEFDPEGDPEL